MWRSIQPCRLSFSMLVACASVVLVGCGHGETRGKITGQVTFQGQPVPEGIVLFCNNEKGVHMNADLKPDGAYEVTTAKGAGLPTGQYQVCICPPPVNGTTGAGPAPKPKPYPNIPQKYRDFRTSGLTLTVKEGINPFDVAMQAPHR